MGESRLTPGDVFAAGLDEWRMALRAERQRARDEAPPIKDEATGKDQSEGSPPEKT